MREGFRNFCLHFGNLSDRVVLSLVCASQVEAGSVRDSLFEGTFITQNET